MCIRPQRMALPLLEEPRLEEPPAKQTPTEELKPERTPQEEPLRAYSVASRKEQPKGDPQRQLFLRRILQCAFFISGSFDNPFWY